VIYWVLYLYIDSAPIEYAYHFTDKKNCDKIGKEHVDIYKFDKYICFKEKVE